MNGKLTKKKWTLTEGISSLCSYCDRVQKYVDTKTSRDLWRGHTSSEILRSPSRQRSCDLWRGHRRSEILRSFSRERRDGGERGGGETCLKSGTPPWRIIWAPKACMKVYKKLSLTEGSHGLAFLLRMCRGGRGHGHDRLSFSRICFKIILEEVSSPSHFFFSRIVWSYLTRWYVQFICKCHGWRWYKRIIVSVAEEVRRTSSIVFLYLFRQIFFCILIWRILLSLRLIS